MIRFSHEANSWQYADAINGWVNISVADARKHYDRGLAVIDCNSSKSDSRALVIIASVFR